MKFSVLYKRTRGGCLKNFFSKVLKLCLAFNFWEAQKFVHIKKCNYFPWIILASKFNSCDKNVPSSSRPS